MSLPVWPATLPAFQLEGHGLKPGNKFKRIGFASGHARHRQISEFEPALASCALRLTLYENMVFDGFLAHDIDGGTDWFLAKIKQNGTVAEKEVRFVPPLQGAQRVDGFTVVRNIRLLVR